MRHLTRILALLALTTLVAAPAAAQAPSAPQAPGGTGAPASDDEKTVYAIGLVLQRTLGQFDLSPAELDLITRALHDAAAGRPAVDIEEWGPRVQGLANARRTRLTEREKTASTAYLAKAAAETGAVRTDSGLVYRETTAGTGAAPTAADSVKVHYRGTLVNGTVFDSSYDRNEPAVFPLGGVIRCWTEGLQRMKVGGKARLACPSDIAYGDEGRNMIPGGAALLFEVELLEIVSAPPDGPPGR